MSATPGQKKFVELILETHELEDDVAMVVENLVQDDEMTKEEGYSLISALLKAPELEDTTDWRIGGVLGS